MEARFLTIVHAVRHRATVTPASVATVFIDDRGGEHPITYGALDAQARVVAAMLAGAGGPRGPVLLLYPQGLEFLTGFLGCLYARRIAVPAYPPDPTRLNRSLPRLLSMAVDAKPSVVLASREITDFARGFAAQAPLIEQLQWLTPEPDGAQPIAADAFRLPEPDELALLQYTSGSTGSPKGIMVTHHNLVMNVELCDYLRCNQADEVSVTWLPSFHDMGLVEALLQPLYVGYQNYLMTPAAFLKDPQRWIAAISRYRATAAGAPNFAYDLCVRKMAAEQRRALDLSRFTYAYNAAEPIRPQTLERFADAFAACGFRPESLRPCYGLAEATAVVSGPRRPDQSGWKSVWLRAAELERNRVVFAPEKSEDARRLVGSGRLPPNATCLIVDPNELRVVGPDEIGEIWLASPCVAQGYWGRPEETEQIFKARTTDGRGPFLRTGDLGFVSPDGELYITGRLKDLVIIRGRNHYPQDIEQTVEESNPAALRPGCSAVFSIDVAGEERLVIVQEHERRLAAESAKDGRLTPFSPHLDDPIDPDKVIADIRRAVAEEHGIEPYAVVLVKPRSILKTSSGKVQRRACRKAYLEGALEAVKIWVEGSHGASRPVHEGAVPGTKPVSAREIEAWLVRELAARLHLPPTGVNLALPFRTLGLGSQQALALIGDLEKWLGVEIPPTLPWRCPTVASLAQHLMTAVANAQKPTR